jgi:hypothetical protein
MLRAPRPEPIRSLPLSLFFCLHAEIGELGRVFGIEHERLALVAGHALEIETPGTPGPIGSAAQRRRYGFA